MDCLGLLYQGDNPGEMGRGWGLGWEGRGVHSGLLPISYLSNSYFSFEKYSSTSSRFFNLFVVLAVTIFSLSLFHLLATRKVKKFCRSVFLQYGVKIFFELFLVMSLLDRVNTLLT